ncbi:MAG TPA: hypothetical protein PJ997_00610 [Candidatus Paceibacterota bacterium]|nr:hypothetical protein [Candidatus Paceibacterota bacterium]HMP18827.1 hypothetical protein [Candidatus Paceibacterota bacterium]
MKHVSYLLVAFILPVVSFAQTLTDGVNTIGGIISSLVPILIGIALLTFIWGVIKYILSKDADGQSEAKSFMIWGIVGLFVIVSVWGIIELLASTFGIGTGGTTAVPTIPGL